MSFSAGAITQNASQTAPTTFSIEAWVQTTTTAGGRILGFGSGSGTNESGTDDRHLYVNTAGKIVFGVGTSSSGPNARTLVTSPAAYNDGSWHHVVGTFSPSGSQRMKLYIDGAQVAASTTNVATTGYTGYWRAAAENLSEWTGGGTGQVLNGTLDELAVYSTMLTPARVTAHYAARNQ